MELAELATDIKSASLQVIVSPVLCGNHLAFFSLLPMKLLLIRIGSPLFILYEIVVYKFNSAYSEASALYIYEKGAFTVKSKSSFKAHGYRACSPNIFSALLLWGG